MNSDFDHLRPTIAGIFVGLLVVFLVFIMGQAIILLGMKDQRQVIEGFSTIAVALGVAVALLTYRYQLKLSSSRDFLAHATDLLEKAYDVLSDPDEPNMPRQDRIAWLTASRLILAAEDLGKKISNDAQKAIYREALEYWRWRFHELINSRRHPLPASFFAAHPCLAVAYLDDEPEPLSLTSLAFMYRFIQWNKAVEDRLGEVEEFSPEEVERMNIFGPRNLGRFLAYVEDCEQGKLTTKDQVPGFPYHFETHE